MSSYDENQLKVQTILERGIGVLAQNYVVRKLDAGEFESVVTAETQFHIAHYEIENVGHLMTMYSEGNPNMQMATYTLVPFFKKLPMFSSDFLYNENGGIFLIELYELVKDRQDGQFRDWIGKYSDCFGEIDDLNDFPTQPCFYDSIRQVLVSKNRDPSRDMDCIQVLVDALKIFIEQEKATELLDEEEAAEQKAIQHKYVDDLIDKGGVSTNVWVNDHGEENVRRFFHDVFFSV